MAHLAELLEFGHEPSEGRARHVARRGPGALALERPLSPVRRRVSLVVVVNVAVAGREQLHDGVRTGRVNTQQRDYFPEIQDTKINVSSKK